MTQIISFMLALSILGCFQIQTCHAAQEWGFEKFLQRHDLNSDGEVEEKEFQGRPRAFERFDLDGDGSVTDEEFKQVRRSRSQPGNNDRAQQLNRELPNDVKVFSDLEYASVDGESLSLDLYLPEKAELPPLIVWIHGGGWTRGDKSLINPAATRLTEAGFAVASLNYRLGGVTLHPKQIHDIKGAIRWLRANAKKYAFDTTRVGVAGGSAGAHLALLLGLSGGDVELEGTVGGNLTESSRVQAIVDLFGPSELQELANEKAAFSRGKSAELLQSASPLQYLDKRDPPLLILHGDKDQVVPLSQSKILHQRYQQAGLDSELHVIKGAGHGGVQFKDPAQYQLIKDFFEQHISKPAAAKADSTSGEASSEQLTRPVQPTSASDTENSRLHGFHWMIGPKSGLAGTERAFNKLLEGIDHTLATNPYITGVYIIYHWRLLEQKEGRPNFDRLDQVIDVVRKHGRYYKLAVNPGIYSPDWLYVKGASSFPTLGSNPARTEIFQKNIRIPLPWDPIFQTSYYDMLAKVAERYRDDTSFRAITLTAATFMSPEWYLPKSAEDMRRWKRMAGYSDKLEQVWKTGIDRFAALFPAQFLVLEASSYPLGLKTVGDAVVHHGVSSNAGRFAVQINQLNGRFDQLEQPTYQKLLAYKKKYGPQIVIGLQNVKGWAYPKIREQQGSEDMTVYNFQQARGEYWELWYGDGKSKAVCELLYYLQQEAALLGLDGFKQKLIKDGDYLPVQTRGSQ